LNILIIIITLFVLLTNLNKINKERIDKRKRDELRKPVQKFILAILNFQGGAKRTFKNYVRIRVPYSRIHTCHSVGDTFVYNFWGGIIW